MPRAVRKPRAPKQPRRSSGGYALPALELLSAPSKVGRTTVSTEALQENATALEGVLGDFGVRGEIINARPGPVVTLYELEPAPGMKSSRVVGLADDIARSMSALSARVAVVSGRNAIGIELPNPTREKVYLRDLLSSHDYAENASKLPLCLGKTIGGESVIADLARMPHLLIAGTTGSGKSVGVNAMILSPLPPAAGPVPADHGRSEDAGALRLRRHPASAHARRHRSEEGGGRAEVGGARDGGPLQADVEDRRAQHRRLQRARRRSQGQGRATHAHGADRFRRGQRRGDLRGGSSSISSRCPTSS